MKFDLKSFWPLAALIAAAILIFRKKGDKMQLSKNLKLEEGFKSATAKARGINNTTTDATIIKNMQLTAQNIYEPLRAKFPGIIISSFYRSPELNRAIKGAKASQHMKGQAIDISATDNLKLFEAAKNLPAFDQVIWEFGTSKRPDWIHVSFSSTNNRRQILRAVRTSTGGTEYIKI